MSASSSRLDPPQLTRLSQPWAVVRFIHVDGVEHRFYSAVNDLTGDRLTGFDDSPPTIGNSLTEVRDMIRRIHTKATVVAIGGPLTKSSMMQRHDERRAYRAGLGKTTRGTAKKARVLVDAARRNRSAAWS